MHLKKVELINSPFSPDYTRLVGEVSYDNRAYNSETYWFDIPKGYAHSSSTTGNPWLTCLLPLALTLGEPLRIDLPVDKVLFKNITKLIQIWKSWYPQLQAEPLEVNLSDTQTNSVAKTAAFFSGGVDAFFTLLKNNPSSNPEAQTAIDHLLVVWGFDISLSNPKAFFRMKDKLNSAALKLNKKLIDIHTNIRTTLWNRADWGKLSHGSALASVALILEKAYSKVLIASTGGYYDLSPWGSHVVTDPLLSTSALQIIHDGAEFNRIQKTQFISNFETAQEALHVCYKHGSDENCSACTKCYRTMIMLDLCNSLKAFKTFNLKKYKTNKIGRILLSQPSDHFYMEQIKTLAREKKRHDILKGLKKSADYSKRRNRLLKLVSWQNKQRFIWRLSEPFKKIILLGAIHTQ